jgi:hypothetical protein
MAFQLELSDEALLGDLIGELAHHGCLANRIAPNTCRIVYPCAWNAREALLEVRFFVRAWQANHPGVKAILTS